MKKAIPFEAAMARLEEITELLSDEALSLDESLALFKEGAALTESCSKQLREAKLKVETLFPREKEEADGTV